MLNLFHQSNVSAKLNALLVLPFSQIVQNLSELIYNLQKERGHSVGAISEKNDSYQSKLAKQR